MFSFGATIRGVGGGVGLAPGVIYVTPGQSGVVGQMTAGFANPTFTRLSGTGFTISSSGVVTLSSGLGLGQSVSAVVRASSTSGNLAAEGLITITCRAVVAVRFAPANALLPTISGNAQVGQILIASPGSWTNDDGLMLAMPLINTILPSITGTAQVGAVLSASTGTWQ